jgi:hypothetical protein
MSERRQGSEPQPKGWGFSFVVSPARRCHESARLPPAAQEICRTNDVPKRLKFSDDPHQCRELADFYSSSVSHQPRSPLVVRRYLRSCSPRGHGYHNHHFVCRGVRHGSICNSHPWTKRTVGSVGSDTSAFLACLCCINRDRLLIH